MLRCPTAAAPVSRGTHLARLAGGWKDCAGCPHAGDLAGAPPALRRRLARRPGERADPWGGVAGAGFGPADAAGLAARFAATLPPRAQVLLATDERPAHAHFAPAVAAALRNAGCDVRRLGPSLEPAVRFLVRSGGSAGGLWLAAPDRPVGHAGLIPVGPGGRPLTGQEREAIAAAAPRVGRTTGDERACDPGDYEASLWPAFRTLSALTISVASPSAAALARLERLFAALPDDLRAVPVPPAAALSEVGDSLKESGSDVRLLIDSFGTRCREFAPGGEPVPWVETVRTLAADAVRRAPKLGEPPTVAVAEALADELRLKLAAAGGRVRAVPDEPAALWDAVERGAVLAAGSGGRAVFATPHGPATDAALTLAALLRAAS